MKLVFAVMVGGFALTGVQASLVPGLFNTGVDGSGSPLPTGTPDIHYTLVGPLSNSVALQRYVNGPNYTWVDAPPGSEWIGPAQVGDSCPPGGFALPADVSLTHRIEASSDLTHWDSATNVALYFKDLDSTNFNERFYRFQEK